MHCILEDRKNNQSLKEKCSLGGQKNIQYKNELNKYYSIKKMCLRMAYTFYN